MFFCGFRDVCYSKRVTRDEEKKKYRTTSLCFHSPYHGLWVLGFFSKRLATFLFNRVKGPKNGRRYMWSLSDSVFCVTVTGMFLLLMMFVKIHVVWLYYCFFFIIFILKIISIKFIYARPRFICFSGRRLF